MAPAKRATRKKAIKNPAPEPMPKCGVIIRKEPGEEGIPCPNDAADVVQLTDPDDPAGLRVTSILLLCKYHSEKMDNGKSYILGDGEGNYILAKKTLNPTPPPDTLTKGDAAS